MTYCLTPERRLLPAQERWRASGRATRLCGPRSRSWRVSLSSRELSLESDIGGTGGGVCDLRHIFAHLGALNFRCPYRHLWAKPLFLCLNFPPELGGGASVRSARPLANHLAVLLRITRESKGIP